MYGPVRTVVWEDGGREASSYPITPEPPDVRCLSAPITAKEQRELATWLTTYATSRPYPPQECLHPEHSERTNQ